MAGKQVRMVNEIPLAPVRVKVEPLSDDDEATVACRICSKSFVSDIALSNHAKMEHFDIYLQGDPNLWTSPSDEATKSMKTSSKLMKIPKVKAEQDVQNIELKTQEILSSMAPGNLAALASQDVSYIIIKAEDDITQSEGQEQSKRKRVRLMKVGQNKDRPRKEPTPITGPFECVQPSNSVEDGVCHQIFFSCCEYSVHYRDDHTRRRKGIRCQVCEKPLGLEDANRAPYTCEVCGAGFNASKELSAHTSEAHVKLKPFQCSVCHKRFTQQGGVMQHMRMHTGDRPFPCTYCAKSFTQKSGLDQHLRIHTKEKPYRCVVCSKSFVQSVHVKQHMRTHTHVAPFQCAICDKRFKQSSHLNYHLRNHNPAAMSQEHREQYARLIMQHHQIDQEIELEQVAAEQSITIVEPGPGDRYILGDHHGHVVQEEMEQEVEQEELEQEEMDHEQEEYEYEQEES